MSKINNTVKLEARWAKESDVEDLGPWCFQMQSTITSGHKSAWLKYVDLSFFKDSNADIKDKVRPAAPSWKTFSEALMTLGAYQGGANQWVERHDNVKACGGVATELLAEEILRLRGIHQATETQLAAIKDELSKKSKEGSPCALFVRLRQKGQAGNRWAIPT